MELLSFIAVTLAAWRARRAQQELNRREAIKRQKLQWLKEELEQLPSQVLIENIKECQEREFEHEEVRSGARVRLRNFFNQQKGERETEIQVSHPEIDGLLTVTFSKKAVCKRREWRHPWHPRRRNPGSD